VIEYIGIAIISFLCGLAFFLAISYLNYWIDDRKFKRQLENDPPAEQPKPTAKLYVSRNLSRGILMWPGHFRADDAEMIGKQWQTFMESSGKLVIFQSDRFDIEIIWCDELTETTGITHAD
jgi:hypothetical protein